MLSQALPETVLGQAGDRHEGAGWSGSLLDRLHLGICHWLLRAQVQINAVPFLPPPGDSLPRTQTICTDRHPSAHRPRGMGRCWGALLAQLPISTTHGGPTTHTQPR